MNRLCIEDRVTILTVLFEGMGVNAACRLIGASKNTVLKLLADIGAACSVYQDRVMRNLKIDQVRVDEIWSFIGMKQQNVPADADPTLGLGDCYTFTAIDPVTQLMLCWMVGFRTSECADLFMADLKPRLANRVQLTTNAMLGYPAAVAKHFGKDVDYAVQSKTYRAPPTTVHSACWHSPIKVIGTTVAVVGGAPDLQKASASHVERANLSMRMGVSRFKRLTNGYSKKIENHMHAVSFYFMVYNFVKIHGSIKCSPAMAAGVADTLWSMENIVMMAETV